MPLVDMSDMLHHAYRNSYAVGAFNLTDPTFLEAILEGAERTRAPVILSLAESHFEHFDFELLMPAVVAAARRAKVPVAIHLDHGTSLAVAEQAIRLGCNGVMMDASHLPFAENAARTREVVEMAHACGIPVEGELGYVAGVEGEDAARHPGQLIHTSPEEVNRFIAETGVDFLAVSVGTVHGRLPGAPRLDFGRLTHITEAVDIPLVIHGGSGLSDDQFRELIARGVAKINYYTGLSDAAAACVCANAANNPAAGYAGLLRDVKDAVRAEVERCIRLWGSADHAEELLAKCRPWREVEHVIVYNTNADLTEQDVEEMMAKGRATLGRIPGVRRVATGRAVKDSPPYRYCWLIRFAQPRVIEAYRDHPHHVEYADTVFRPNAADRITIDFETLD